MPVAVGYLNKLAIFHVLRDAPEKYKLDCNLPYAKNYIYTSVEEAKAGARRLLTMWLTATNLKEDDE